MTSSYDFLVEQLAHTPEHLAVLQAVVANWPSRRHLIARGSVDGMALEAGRHSAGYLAHAEQGLRLQLEERLAADRMAGQIVIEHPTRWWQVGDRRAYGFDLDLSRFDPSRHREVTVADMLAGRHQVVTDLFIAEAAAVVIPAYERTSTDG